MPVVLVIYSPYTCADTSGHVLFKTGFSITAAAHATFGHWPLATGYWNAVLLHAGVAALHGNTSLTSLNLAVCREVTDVAVEALASLPHLAKLDMTFCDRLTDAVVPHLARSAPSLTSRYLLLGRKLLQALCFSAASAKGCPPDTSAHQSFAMLCDTYAVPGLSTDACVQPVMSEVAVYFSHTSSEPRIAEKSVCKPSP